MSDHAAQSRKPDKSIRLINGNMVHKSNRNDLHALDRAKSNEFKLIRVDVNQRYTVGYKGKSSRAAEDVNLISYAPQSAETHIVDRKKFEIGESSTMRRNMELFNDEATFSEKISSQQLTKSSIKWKNFSSYNSQNPDVSQPELEHFPMFDINRKIEAIMASNKKIMTVKMKESFSLPEKVMMPHEDLLPDNSVNIGEPSSRFFQINGKLLTTGGRSNADSNSSILGSSWTSVKNGSTRVIRESSPSYSPSPSSSDRHHAQKKDDFTHRLFLGQKRFTKPDGSDLHHWPRKTPKSSMHDVNLSESFRNFKPVENGERLHKLSSTIKQLLDTDKVLLDQCFKEPTMGHYAFAQVKENTSSERRIIPIGPSYGKKDTTGMPFGNFRSDDEKNDRHVSGARVVGASNESSTRTDTMCIHPLYRSRSILGEAFSSAQQGVAPSNLGNSETTSALPEEQAARSYIKTGITERRVEHPADRPTYASHNAAGTSQTETMSMDHNMSLTMIADNTSGSDTCSRWIKRLQDHHSEALSLCSKRFKNDNASSSENYNLKIISSSKTVMPCCGDSEKSVQSWIGRWSHTYHEVSPYATRAPPREPKPIQQEGLKALPEKFEGRVLGSIRAMALMGKTMNNHRPCKYRRKKASLVWNTSE